MSPTPDSRTHRPLGALACPEPDERPDLWPWSTRRREDGVLEIGGVTVTQLAQEFATPLAVLDSGDVRGRASVWATVMAEEFWEGYGMAGADALCASALVSIPELVRMVADEGMSLYVDSVDDLRRALRAGVSPSQLSLRASAMSDSELEAALGACEGVACGRIYVESVDDVARLENIAACLSMRLQVTICVTRGLSTVETPALSSSHEGQTVGDNGFAGAGGGDNTAHLAEVCAAIEAAAHLELRGLHAEICPQCVGAESFDEAADTLFRCIAALTADMARPLPEISLSGGVDVAYAGDDPAAPSPLSLARALATAVRKSCEETGMPIPRVVWDPGPSTLAPALTYLMRVEAVTDSPLDDTDMTGKCCRRVRVNAADTPLSPLLSDGSCGDTIRHTAILANRLSEAPLLRSRLVNTGGESEEHRIWEVDLPADITAGDLLLVPVIGACVPSHSSLSRILQQPRLLAVESGTADWLRSVH